MHDLDLVRDPLLFGDALHALKKLFVEDGRVADHRAFADEGRVSRVDARGTGEAHVHRDGGVGIDVVSGGGGGLSPDFLPDRELEVDRAVAVGLLQELRGADEGDDARPVIHSTGGHLTVQEFRRVRLQRDPVAEFDQFLEFFVRQTGVDGKVLERLGLPLVILLCEVRRNG